MEILQREASAIITSLSAGLTPSIGARHIAVGRLREVSALKQDLDRITDGGASVRFVLGRYGSGKSFLLQLIRAYAMESRFVVSTMDFSPERRLFGTNGEGLATYREILGNLSTQTRPSGNALPTIIERWISSIQTQVATESECAPDSPRFAELVKGQIMQTMTAMHELVHGFDFAQVIISYYQAFLDGNEAGKGNAIRWLRGEYSNKTEAYASLKVRAVIDENNYYDYLKILARFVCKAGYSGLLICLDEAAYLYKLSNSVSRKNNYEVILKIVNDCLQGGASSIGFVFGSTPEFLEDQRRGLFSYEALRTRLSGNRYAIDGMIDLAGPVISLSPLSNEETFVLLQKVLGVYNRTLPEALPVDDAMLKEFMEDSLRRIGKKEFSTPREFIRDFISLLNLLAQYPEKTWSELLNRVKHATARPDPTAISAKEENDPLDRFSDFGEK